MLIRLNDDEAARLETLREVTGARSCTEVVRALVAHVALEGEPATAEVVAMVREGRARLERAA